MVDNKIVERRKPFQQFHYYDSYTDIVYNSIKASEAQMKTNAVGIWQSSAMLWGREQYNELLKAYTKEVLANMIKADIRQRFPEPYASMYCQQFDNLKNVADFFEYAVKLMR